MPDKEKLSKTMRIDLIPEAPSEPVVGKKKRIVISRPARKLERERAFDESVEDARYNELLQSVYDAALITDLTGKIVNANVRAVEFFLYDREDLCALTIFDVISGADDTLIKTLCQNLENQRFTLIQAYCIRSDGSFFPSEIAVNEFRLGERHLCFFIRYHGQEAGRRDAYDRA